MELCNVNANFVIGFMLIVNILMAALNDRIPLESTDDKIGILEFTKWWFKIQALYHLEALRDDIWKL